ncbi:hypothetical protein THRCLA_08792 [Thraustotheca clavata]|uniref:DDE-1 domain-containing protein n=1 Tax=Thraustotheca clavata TaxID=74557 RepID=A0A1V9Z270_9STRA|nr:hypothetical protein THRCLA_08792 [Thraustotheca clavata]
MQLHNRDSTVKFTLKAPFIDALVQWISDAWNFVKPSIIIKGFKRCGLDNLCCESNTTEDAMCEVDSSLLNSLVQFDLAESVAHVEDANLSDNE